MRGVDSSGLLQKKADLIDAGDISGKAPDALAPVLHECRLHNPHLQLGACLLHNLHMTAHMPLSFDYSSSYAGHFAVSIHRAVSSSEGHPDQDKGVSQISGGTTGRNRRQVFPLWVRGAWTHQRR